MNIEISEEELNEYVIRSQEEFDIANFPHEYFVPMIYRFGFVMMHEIDDYEARDDYMYKFEGKMFSVVENTIERQTCMKNFSKCLIEIEIFQPPDGSKFAGGYLYLQGKLNFEKLKMKYKNNF